MTCEGMCDMIHFDEDYARFSTTIQQRLGEPNTLSLNARPTGITSSYLYWTLRGECLSCASVRP